jgi:hypothetical protein
VIQDSVGSLLGAEVLSQFEDICRQVRNWIAGQGGTHFYNVHSDALVGSVDRRNYHKGQLDRHWQPALGSLNNGQNPCQLCCW